MNKILKIYTDWNGNVNIWTRENGLRKKTVITDFQPYYWLKENDSYKKVYYNWKNKWYIDLTNENIKEADLSTHKLWLIENEPEFEDEYNILYYDIETKDTEGGVEIGRDRIISICCVDNDGNEFICCDDDEIVILRQFKELLLDYDVIVGWNSDKFDLPYLRERFKLHRVYFNFQDVNHLDLMKVFMKSYIVQRKLGEHFLRSYSLSNIAQLFLGEDKLKDPNEGEYGGRLWKLFNEDRETLIKYNLQDSRLLMKLDKELNLLLNQIELSKITGVNLEDTIYQSRMIDIYTLRHSKKLNYHFPTVQRGIEKAKYEGGIVEIDKPGFYKNVAIADFKSMYPSLIRTFNISPETLLDDDSIEEHYLTFNNVKFSKKQGIIPMIMNNLIEYRFKLRDEQRKYPKESQEFLKCEIKQIAVKILALSYYGVLGSAFSRYFSLKLAESITVNGQNLIRELIKFINTKDYVNWLYSDTDCLFCIFDDLRDIDKFKIEIDEYINKIIKERTGTENKYMDLEIEKIFDKFIILSKKKYVGRIIGEDTLYEDKNKIWVYNKGLELVKSDQVILAKTLLTKVISEILEKDSDLDNIINIIDKYKDKIVKGDVTVDEITCSAKVSKMPDDYKTLPAHVKMAWERKKLGERFYTNMKVNFIITKHSPIEIVHPSEFTGEFDREHYWNVKIFNPTKRLLEVVFPDSDWDLLSDISNAVTGQKLLSDFA